MTEDLHVHNNYLILFAKAAARGALWKKMFLEISQNLQENAYVRVSFFINFIKKEVLEQVFSYEFC